MSEETSNEPFTAEEVGGMVRHMNDDHADSVLAYARHFGGQSDATEATLTTITSAAMGLRVKTPSGIFALEIPFDRSLQSTHDAHRTLIRMSKQAKRGLENAT